MNAEEVGCVSGGRLTLGLATAGMRLLVGALVAAVAAFYPESHLLVIADLPTIAIYAALAFSGHELPLSGAFDLRFLVIGMTSWFLLGVLLSLASHRVSLKRMSSK